MTKYVLVIVNMNVLCGTALSIELCLFLYLCVIVWSQRSFLMLLILGLYSCVAVIALSYISSIMMTQSFALLSYDTVPTILVFLIFSILYCNKSKPGLCKIVVGGMAFVLAVLILHSEHHPCHRTVESDRSTQDRVTSVLQATVRALESNNVDYWINGGTLLGVYLNNTVIAWDYDADLFLPRTMQSLNTIRWSDYGLISYTGWDGIVRVKRSRFSSIRVDLFMVHFKDGHQWFNDDHINTKYPKETLLTTDDIYPLRRYNMTSGQVWGPSRPANVLHKLYPGRSTKLNPQSMGGIFRYVELQLFTRFGSALLFEESVTTPSVSRLRLTKK